MIFLAKLTEVACRKGRVLARQDPPCEVEKSLMSCQIENGITTG